MHLVVTGLNTPYALPTTPTSVPALQASTLAWLREARLDRVMEVFVASALVSGAVVPIGAALLRLIFP